MKVGDEIEVMDREIGPWLIRGVIVQLDEHPLAESFAEIRFDGAGGSVLLWVNLRLAKVVK